MKRYRIEKEKKVHKYLKICSIELIIKEIHFKTTKYIFTRLSDWQRFWKLVANTQGFQEYNERRTLIHWNNLLENHFDIFCKVHKNTCTE